MRAGSDKWWLLPFGIFAVSMLVVLGVVVLEPSLAGRPSAEVVQQAASEPDETSSSEATDCSDAPASDDACHQEERHQEAASEVATAGCSDASANDFACLQKHYQDLVRNSGVQAAFAELKNELPRSDLVSSNCHELTHVIGHAAVGLYGDIPNTYSHGDSFCWSGYYHGAMEAIVAKIGADKVLEEVDTLCAGLDSFYHYNCAHGLGHGFMRVQENELFESLEMCDELTDRWESNRCYGGVFMENVIDEDNPVHPSKYLKADQPFYPCNVVEDRYKDECYQRQSSYALKTQGNDFARVFEMCGEVAFRASCYQGLGWDASVQSLKQSIGDVNGSTRALCMLGGGYEARFNCVVGAVEYFVRHYYSDAQAKVFCETLSADLGTACLQEVEEYYSSLQSPLER